MKTKMSKRKLEVSLMIGALILLFAGIPAMIYMGNAWNGLFSATQEYDQIENTTAFYDGPILDDDAEYRYGAYNGTTVTEETPSWDTNLEWDSITLVNTGADPVLVFNVNDTATDLLNTNYNMMRLKINFTKHTTVSVYAVKWDGVTLTSVLLHTAHADNESTTVYYNWTPSGLLSDETTLNPASTDEQWIQIRITGFDDDNVLEAGDTIEFQFAYGGPSGPYAFTSFQILKGVATISGIFLILVGMASTPYWNPLGNSRPKRSNSPRKRTTRRRRRRK